MPLEIAARCHMGLVRGNNEDMYLVSDRPARDEPWDGTVPDDRDLLAAVADGMGGHAHGEIASRRVLEMLADARSEGRLPRDPADHRFFTDILVSIHKRLLREQGPDAPLAMGATLVGLWRPAGAAPCWFHAGDSRLYRWREDGLVRLTEDHTMVNQMIRAGQDPGNLPRHMVTSCMGGGINAPQVDTGSADAPPVTGERFLLCSDGLTDMVPDSDLAAMLGRGTAAEAADALVAAALDGGGRDNITVVVIRAV